MGSVSSVCLSLQTCAAASCPTAPAGSSGTGGYGKRPTLSLIQQLSANGNQLLGTA